MEAPRRADLRQIQALKNTLRSWVQQTARNIMGVRLPLQYDSTTGIVDLAGLNSMGSANEITRVKSDATGWEYIVIEGATDQISISHQAGKVVISLPASPDVTTGYKVGGTQVVGSRQAAISDVTAADISATAGATYTATEQGMLNDLKALANELKADVDALKAAMRAHGSIAS